MDQFIDNEPSPYNEGVDIDSSALFDGDGLFTSRTEQQDIVDDPERDFLSLFDI